MEGVLVRYGLGVGELDGCWLGIRKQLRMSCERRWREEVEGGGVWEEEFGFVFGGEEEVGVGGLFEVCEGQERGVGLVWV